MVILKLQLWTLLKSTGRKRFTKQNIERFFQRLDVSDGIPQKHTIFTKNHQNLVTVLGLFAHVATPLSIQSD